jgi:hypothetical protein
MKVMDGQAKVNKNVITSYQRQFENKSRTAKNINEIHSEDIKFQA